MDVKCPKCNEAIIPDIEAQADGTDEWDKHSYRYPCDCMDENLCVCIG